MYQVIILNGDVETVIHYPSSDVNDPHLDELPLTEGLSTAGHMEFNMYRNNPGYNKISDLVTRVKIKDVRDDSIRFTGRVFTQSEEMDSSGKIYKKITCEGALGFLNDTNQRANTFITSDVRTFITQILNDHNSKVDSHKQIQVGNINVTDNVAHTCEFKTTLAEILEVKEKVGGHIRVREVNNIIYLDWLTDFNAGLVDIKLGINMKDMIIHKDITSFGTRIIPIGANNLTIASVNNGYDYIEDASSKYVYGVIEKIVEYKDITDANVLMQTCISDLSKHSQPLYILESSALDLSFLSGNKVEQFVLGTNLHLVNEVMAVDSVYKIVGLDVDLLKPYNPKLTISNSPVKLTTAINDLRKSSIQKESVMNGVQVGNEFGIRIVNKDGSIITTLNATEGISIENINKNLKVFYIDTEGNLTLDGKQTVTSNGNRLIENWKNDNGGVTKIYDNNGNLNISLGVENGTAGNNGGTLIILDDGEPKIEMSSSNGAGIINIKDNVGPCIALYSEGTNSKYGVFVREEGRMNQLASRRWVMDYVASNSSPLQ